MIRGRRRGGASDRRRGRFGWLILASSIAGCTTSWRGAAYDELPAHGAITADDALIVTGDRAYELDDYLLDDAAGVVRGEASAAWAVPAVPLDRFDRSYLNRTDDDPAAVAVRLRWRSIAPPASEITIRYADIRRMRVGEVQRARRAGTVLAPLAILANAVMAGLVVFAIECRNGCID